MYESQFLLVLLQLLILFTILDVILTWVLHIFCGAQVGRIYFLVMNLFDQIILVKKELSRGSHVGLNVKIKSCLCK